MSNLTLTSLSNIKPLKTERLYISPIASDDTDDFYHAVIDSLDNLLPWMVWTKDPFDRDYAQQLVKSAIDLQSKDLALQFCLRYQDQMVGMISLNAIEWNKGLSDIGYWVRSAHQKKGYILESVKALLGLCFNDFNFQSLSIRCAQKNSESQKIPQKLGFKLDFKFPDLISNKKNEISYFYSLHKNDYFSS
ncbi:MAG: GNAT family N-acetyltransferase [Alphaproteobacteria bacterium]|nr:GNAT family N-acetyltransferase [Alphaproteobacteria bacterium]